MTGAWSHDFSGTRAQTIGVHGLSPSEWEESLGRARGALERLRGLDGAGALALLGLVGEEEDLEALGAAAAFLTTGRRALFVFGTGGSSLGGQVLCQHRGWRVPGVVTRAPQGHPFEVHFFDNCDPGTMAALCDPASGWSWSEVAVLFVSKSGATPETVAQALALLDSAEHLGFSPSSQAMVITEEGDLGGNPLLQIARDFGMRTLPHPPGIGGRYSLLTATGLLPALCLGGDGRALRAGAAAALAPLRYGVGAEGIDWVLGAIHTDALVRHHGVSGIVCMPYCDRLRAFSSWFCQLWAESLGKHGQGTQPIAAAGPVDQHSQLQLFLDGPRDKLLWILAPDVFGTGPKMGGAALPPGLAYLSGRTIGDLVGSQIWALQNTFEKAQRPLRLLSFANLDAYTLGGIAMHFMLETIVLGFMMGVDPFDQPAVEDAKRATRAYLGTLEGRS